MKKILLIMLTVITMFSLFSASAVAVDTPTSGSCGENIRWNYDESAKTLTISGSGNMLLGDDVPWYAYRDSIETAVVENGITSVANKAFFQCNKLTSVSLPDSITSIGEYAFCECTSLAHIDIPDRVTQIGRWAFSDCIALMHIDIPGGVTKISRETFESCENLQSVNLPDGLLSIDDNAFNACKNLDNVVIPDSVTSIGYAVFRNCEKIKSINVPANVQSIGEIPFPYEIDEIYYAGTINNWLVINEKTVLGRIYCNDGNVYYHCGKDAYGVFDKATGQITVKGTGTIGLIAHYNKTSDIKSIVIENGITGIENLGILRALETIKIPDSVKSIGVQAFSQCENLRSVVIPNGVTKIEDYTFYRCGSLESVVIPDSVTSIGKCAFAHCESLKSIEIPDSVRSIGEYAFAMCVKLSKVVIPEGVTTIERGTFDFCSELQSVTIPKSVKRISQYAFSGNKLTEVKYAGTQAEWNAIDIEARNDILKLKPQPQKDKSFSNLNCGENVTASFDAKTGVLTISGSGDMADFHMEDDDMPWWNVQSDIKSIVVEAGVTSIGDYTFDGCSNLAEVSLPEGLVSIGENAFAGCSSLQQIEIPATVKEIYPGALQSCNFKSIILPDGLEEISIYLFYYCKGLESVTIPQSVKLIREYAFYGCDNLKQVNYAGTDDEWQAIKIEPDNMPLFNIKPQVIASFDAPCGKNAIAHFDAETGTLTISGSGEITLCPWENVKDFVKTVVIENGITGGGSFVGLRYLTTVKLPDDSQYVKMSSFGSCWSLTEITIPEGITSIPNQNFDECINLVSVTLPKTLKEIGSGAFQACKSLRSIVIPEGVTVINGYTFNGCESMTSAVIPEGVLDIQEAAFAWCVKLNSISIPKSVKIIGFRAFTNCPNLKNINYSGTDAQWAAISIAAENDALKRGSNNDKPGVSGGGGGSGSGSGSGSATVTTGKPSITGDGNGGKVVADDKGNVTITPDAGYKVKDVTVNDKSVGAKTSLTGMTTNDNIVVIFEKDDTAVVNPSANFADVPAGHWAEKAVAYVYENGLFQGTSENAFEPNTTMNRCMLVTVLWRLDGKPAVNVQAAFADVKSGDYYSEAVAWANANGIVKGYTDNHFAPNDKVTREQMAAILVRYAEHKGYAIAADADLSAFTDSGKISAYALDGIKWANSVGLMTGRTSNTLAPQGDSTRAEVAIMIQRFVNNVIK